MRAYARAHESLRHSIFLIIQCYVTKKYEYDYVVVIWNRPFTTGFMAAGVGSGFEARSQQTHGEFEVKCMHIRE